MTVLSYSDPKYNGRFFLSCKSRCFKTANIKILSSKAKFNPHKLDITSFQSAACHKCKKLASVLRIYG